MTKGFRALLVVLAFSAPALAGTITINFEQYPSEQAITNQYAATDDVTFMNATQLVAADYNSTFYPPHSGNGVIDNGPGAEIVMTFLPGFGSLSVSGWYTDGSGLVATAYDAGGDVLQTFDGAGDISTSEPFSLTGGTTPISSVTFDDLYDSKYSLVLDDISFTPQTITPEPGSFLLMGSALTAVIGLGILRRRRV